MNSPAASGRDELLVVTEAFASGWGPERARMLLLIAGVFDAYPEG